MMIRLSAALIAASAFATPVLAQQVPNAQVAVVDLDRIGRDCNACKAAATTLQSQVNAFNTRRQQLNTQLQPERTTLQTAVNALNGKQPDAALTTRLQAFQQKEVAAAQELEKQQNQIQRNQAYISQQINAKLAPLLQPAMQKRGANILLDGGAAIRFAPTVDITNDVLASLNVALPSVVTIAPAQPAQTSPQGR
ncbi:OmpH family outer membrane protein [Sphingomonas sp.]|uniref:OmpH family outer membrane protein n=1 Tax=Sphingomonas sp. TaxID=28214 RepID=UPI0025D4D934|nr:OmpH family outer membrane protein [Sphingomonas sp.]